uniref:Centromere protein Q n=1 Tax=Geotrypetes seraphini TaxID=260995 RepID=A0A6P8R2E0_GEOSA|nr:centromere protein Q [Geotrypetes seraphini]XP_033794154.1 centromere protein Q [Geotrypetes seraphini]
MFGKKRSVKKGKTIQQSSCSSKQKVIQPARKRQRQFAAKEAKGLDSLNHKISLKCARTATWKPLPNSSQEYLKAEMDEVVLSLFGQKILGKEDLDTHLNTLRVSLLKDFQNLKVPTLNLGSLKNTQNHLAQEEQLLKSSQETLELLQGEIANNVKANEELDEEIQSLQQKIKLLQNEKVYEERKTFQLSSTGFLTFSQLSKYGMEVPFLQNDMPCVGDQVGLLKDLNTVHNSAVVQKVQMLLEHAYEKTDEL